MVNLKKCLLGELVAVTRGASLSGNYYSTKGEYIRLTCGNFDYRNNCFKENTSKDNLFYTGVFKAEVCMGRSSIISLVSPNCDRVSYGSSSNSNRTCFIF